MTSSRPVQLFEAGTRRGRSMEVAAGLVVALSLVPLIVYTEVGDAAWIVWADRAFWALFTVEYAARLVTARERVRYARSFYGIVDLLAVLSGVASLPALASVKLDFVAPTTTISPATKFLTVSEKVTVAVKAPAVVVPVTSVVIATVGAVLSTS